MSAAPRPSRTPVAERRRGRLTGARRGPAIPLADADRFRALIRRTTLVRAGLGLGLLALLAGTLLAAFGLREQRSFLPSGTSGVIVLDVSASITPDTYRRIQTTVSELAASREHYGLVLFSDVAYEALPPGTPADELAPLVRWFKPRGGPAAQVSLPRNPWSNTVAGGTSISTGLNTARQALRRDGIDDGSVLLVSDLDDDPTDLTGLSREIDAYNKEGIELRVVGLDPGIEDRRLFARLVPGGLIENAAPAPGDLEEPRTIVSADVSGGLVAGGGALLVLLALNEHWCGRLAWRPRFDREEAA
ncbi:MAG: hypothetical protein GEU93_20520 [Propionibacteriales bacterium]|nr:hypothetical protein [Propionibacteriales bacterium]